MEKNFPQSTKAYKEGLYYLFEVLGYLCSRFKIYCLNPNILLINTIKTLKRSRDINQLSVVTRINRETHYSQNELNFSSYFSSTK